MSRILDCWALFLDFDGTLVDIAPRPDRVQVPVTLRPLLARLSVHLNGALAILTGRPIREIDHYLRPLKLPTAGVHGAEMRIVPCGQVQSTVPDIDDRLAERVASMASIDKGVVIERKRSSISVHFRLAEASRPEIEDRLRAAIAEHPGGLTLCPGRKVLEIVPKAISKGSALATLMRNPAFAGRVPVVVGDDLADESAFEMALRLGGTRKRVAGEHFAAPDAEFTSPTHVRSWLSMLAQTMEVE